jgi:acyl-CoA synthetase (AMP-forming)/AMP-acid ligase II
MFLELRFGRLVEPVSGRAWEADETRRQVASRLAAYRARGMRRGDRVFLHLGNRLEFFAELLAVWEAGACAIPVDGRLTPFEVETLAAAARPTFCVIDDGTDPETLRGLGQAEVVRTGEATGGSPADARGIGGPRLDDDALILFTSGSTGSPKGVVHTHRSLRARWITLGQSLGIEPYARTLCLLPTHFGHGLICNCLFPWLSGQDLFVTPPFRPELLLRLGSIVDSHRISFLSSVPSVWRLALKAPRPTGGTLRRIHVGSAPLSAALWDQIRDWAAIDEVFNAYGITETGSWVAGTSGESGLEPRDGLIGRPWGAVIKVLTQGSTEDALTPDLECPVGQSGFVWINTPALMRGYFQRDDLTEAVVRDGWFLTGDIGLIDERGRLVLKGREREEINKGGMKIYPADVDGIIERFPGVSDVCTFGYADPAYGEEVGVALVLGGEDPILRELYEWVETHLARHKIPQRWYLVEEIPRTSRGKINRANVAETCARLSPLAPDRLAGQRA